MVFMEDKMLKTGNVTDEAERLRKLLNHSPELELFWSGRADVRVKACCPFEIKAEVSVLEGHEKRVAPIMEAAGYEQVGKPYVLDVGDEDCPKPEVTTTWAMK
jgi:hypothetical protein